MMDETNEITIECDNNHNTDNVSTLPTGTSTTDRTGTEDQEGIQDKDGDKEHAKEQGSVQE